MIGPHQGKELELMLAGKKHLAVFSDAVPQDGIIPEDIIPEFAFSPYVSAGLFIRFQHERSMPNEGDTANIIIRTVCFASKEDGWRAQAYLWMQNECLANRCPFDDAYEFFIGRLLDYEEADISHFIEHQRSFRRKVRA